MPLDYDLIESENRRDTFAAESEPIILSDGQEWFFPKPWVAIRPLMIGEEVYGQIDYLTVGPKLDSLVEAVLEADDAVAQIQGIQQLGIHILRRNYNLNDDEIAILFTFRFGDPICIDWLKSIIELATGQNAPKLSGGGDG